MPRLDGQELLRRIKGVPRTCKIPVVVLTSSSEEEDVMRTYETGANSYIIKPVDFEHFPRSRARHRRILACNQSCIGTPHDQSRKRASTGFRGEA